MLLLAAALLVGAEPAPEPRAKGAFTLAHILKHDAPVVAVALSSDRGASADEAGAVYLWDAKTGALLQTAFTAKDKAGPVTHLRFSANGDWLLLITHAGARCHALECRKPKAEQVFSTFSVGGTWRAVGISEAGDSWALSTGRGAPWRHGFRSDAGGPVGESLAAFAPDLKKADAPTHFAATGDRMVSFTKGTLTGRAADERAKGWSVTLLNVEPTALALSANGARVAVASDEGAVRVYNANSGQPLPAARGHTGGALTVALSADGKLVASGGVDRAARVWDALSGDELFALTGHAADVTAVAFAPNGSALVTGSTDKTVRVWVKPK